MFKGKEHAMRPHLTGTRRNVITLSLFASLILGVIFVFAPVASIASVRQALASRVNASPTANSILEIAPAPVRNAIKTRLKAASTAMNAAMFAPYTVTQFSVPAPGPVGQGQIIVYTFDITNNGAGDATAPGGFFQFVDLNTTQPFVQFSLPTVVNQPAGSTPWVCGINPGGHLECSNGDQAGPGIETFAAGATLTVRVTATVQNNAPYGTNITNGGQFFFEVNGTPGPEVNETANLLNHIVGAPVDLAITKTSHTAAPAAGDPAASVVAGGASVALTSLADVGTNEGAGNISYLLAVANIGGNRAVNTAIEDTVPAGPAVLTPATLFAGPPVAGSIIPAFPAVTTISINGGGSNTEFRFNCANLGIGQTFNCVPGDNTAIDAAFGVGILPEGFRGRIGYRLQVSASANPGSVQLNQARIFSTGSPDVNAGNNTSLPTQNVVVTKADLGITKATSNATPTNGGAAFSYTLVVTNNGPSDARNIVVNDPLPAGINFQNVTVVNNPSIPGYGLSCTGPAVGVNGLVTCTGNLPGPAPGPVLSTSTITIVAQAAPNLAGGVRTNSATVLSDTQEPTPNTAPNTASVQQNLQVDAPLSITKAGPATICAGDTYTYHLTVNNGGSSTALNATISDPLPANTTFLSYSGTGAFADSCSHNGGTPGTVTCAAVDIPSGLSTLDITVRLSPAAPAGALGNTATITTAGTGTIAVGTSTSTATVNHCTDLEITKTASPDPIAPGENLTYTVSVKNLGPSNSATGEAVVSDTFPAGTTIVGTIAAPGWSCNAGAAFPCTSTAPIPAGATSTITFTLNLPANFGANQVVNTASVAIPVGTPPATAVDSNSNNNSSTATTQVIRKADLAIQKQSFTLAGSAFDAQVTAGGAISAAPPTLPVPIVTGQGEIFYGLTYRNNGPSDSINVHIRDVIPANSQFVPGSIVVTPAAGPALTCTVSPLPTELDCTPTGGGTLPAGANGTITFRTRVLANVPEATAIRNTATINSEGVGATSATGDPSGGNNSATTQNRVRTEANLSIAKTGPANVVAGAPITYVLTVVNNGVSDAQSVVVKDTLPNGVTFLSATSSSGSFSCSATAFVVDCTAATLIANDPNIFPPRSGSNTEVINIIGRVNSGIANGTVLANNATVTAATSDPVLANNSVGPINTTVVTEAAVTIAKSDSPDPVVAGTNLTYTISVSNAGPSNAVNLVVSDPLPANTTFVSVSGTGAFSLAGVCAHNGAVPGVVTCTLGQYGPGIQTITIVVKVNADYPSDTITNTATADWEDSNGVVGPLVANTTTTTATTTVTRAADLAIQKTTPGSGIAGGVVDFTIKLTNSGPSDVFGGQAPGSIVISDPLPNGSSLANIPNNVVVTGPGGFTCAENAGVLTCLNAAGAPGNFPVGSVTTIIVKLLIPSSTAAGTNFCNTATVSIDGEVHPLPVPVDPNPGNNSSTACVVVSTSSDLTVAKTSQPVVDPDGAGPLAPVPLPPVGPNVPAGAVSAGGYLRYDVPFGNNGPSDAINVLLSNVVPANTAFVGALVTGGVYVPAAQPPAVPFTFTIQGTDAVAPVGPSVSLSCTVIGAPGTQQIFCVPQGNGGLVPPYADGVLPAGYNGTLTFFVKVNESVTGGTIITDPAIVTSGLCPAGGAAPFPPVPCPGTNDPNSSNNVSPTTQNVVVANSNLTVSKIVQSAVTSASNPNQTGPIGPATAPNGPGLTGTAVLPGTFLTYRVTITNNGPSDVSNIRLTDVLPSGLETPPGRVLGAKFISVSQVVPSGATFTCAPPAGVNPNNNPQSNGGSIACTAPLLSANAPNNTAAIDITVFIDPATHANLVNTATVDATLNNFNQPISGTATLTTPVAATSDLALTKTHTNAAGVLNGPVIAGTTFTYAITLTNNGPSSAQTVSVVDTLPAFQKVTAISIAQTANGSGNPNFSCVANPVLGAPGNTTSVTCTATELPPNKNPDNTVNPSGTVVITLTVLQDPATPQPVPLIYTNCVSVTSTSTDPIPANSTSVCHDVGIGFQADADTTTLQKVDSPDPVIAGTLLTYTITGVNNGPSNALNYQISDPLPSNVRFISAVASPGATLTTPAVDTVGTVTATWDAAGGTPAGLTGVGVVRTLTIVVRVCPDVTCNTVISNTAQSTSLTTDPQLPNNSDTATTTVQSQSDLSITKTDSPDPVKPSYGAVNQYLTYTIQVANAGPSNSANTIVTDVLPPGFTIFSTSSTIPGTVFTESVGGETGDQITVTANLGVLGAANQCATTPRPTSGTITIVVRIPNKFPNSFVTNTATIASGNCLPDPNPADNTATAVTEVSQEPQSGSAGLAWPALAEASDDKSGSVLFYPLYTSNASVPAQQNTTISLTNTGIFDAATVHLFVVDGATCSAQDVFICLTPNQTISFLASDFDPGVTGYIVAVAVNPVSGRPVSFNCLAGDAYVKYTTGHRASYGAVAASTLLNNPAGVDPLATTAVLKFDGIHYNRLPRILAVDGIPSPGEGNSTMISLMAVGGNFSLTGSILGSLTGNLFDDRENNYSFNESAPNCMFVRTLSDNFPRTFTPFSGVVSPGHSGWMKIRAFQDIGILGVMLNYNQNAATAANAFSNGRGLHGMTLTGASQITIPVDIPECR